VSTSKAGARVGGLALALGIGAILLKRRRSLIPADSSRSATNAVADPATPHFEFTGQPSGNTTVAVTVLRAVGAVTDFLGPDQIDLTRGSPKRHLAFGHGIHFCVGAALARIEARAVLQAVLEQTRDFAPEPDHQPEWVDSLLVRRHQRLRVSATPL
jgi:cytochrome P450